MFKDSATRISAQHYLFGQKLETPKMSNKEKPIKQIMVYLYTTLKIMLYSKYRHGKTFITYYLKEKIYRKYTYYIYIISVRN